MPTCPKCGKILSNDNTLLYHLNKKFPCDSYKCKFCKEIFGTKFHLQVHEMKCEVAKCANKKKLSLNPFENAPASRTLDDGMLRFIYNTCPDIITEIDMNCKILSISPSVERILGTTQDELVKNDFWDLIHDEDKERVIEHFIDTKKMVPSAVPDGSYKLNAVTDENDLEYPYYTSLRKRHKEGRWVNVSSVFWITERADEIRLICVERPTDQSEAVADS